MINYIGHLLGKVYCFFGFHHYHDINEASKAVVRMPEGMKIKARFCCRCHDLDIQDISFGDKA